MHEPITLISSTPKLNTCKQRETKGYRDLKLHMLSHYVQKYKQWLLIIQLERDSIHLNNLSHYNLVITKRLHLNN